ncbi:MAG TPA: hypothetical protein VFX30_07740 [bacterium]|nr:hypothetical protein [bacterium]
MNHRPIIYLFLLTFLATALLMPAQAHAYLDPGTGGLLYQMGFAMLSFVLGALFLPLRSMKNFFASIKNKLFSRTRNSSTTPNNE